MQILCAPATSPLVKELKSRILDLIRDSSLKLRTHEVESLFRPGHDFVLTFKQRRLVGVVVARRCVTAHEIFVGFLVAVVESGARRCGLLGKMTARYFLRTVPWMLWRKLANPRLGIYLFADISNPVSYHRLHIGQEVLPDLVHGTARRDHATVAALRLRLAAAAGIEGVDPATGVIANGSTAGDRDKRPRPASIDGAWQQPWDSYVPVGADLLAIVPVELGPLIQRFLSVVRISVLGTLKVSRR